MEQQVNDNQDLESNSNISEPIQPENAHEVIEKPGYRPKDYYEPVIDGFFGGMSEDIYKKENLKKDIMRKKLKGQIEKGKLRE